MTTTPPLIDLDAAKRETRYPDGVPVLLKGTTFTLPAELPIETFDPLLSDELGLVATVTSVLEAREERKRIAVMNDEDTDTDADENLGEAVVKALTSKPTLPRETKQAVLDTFAVLFGDQWDTFLLQRPSVSDLLRLAKHLLPIYAVSLGEAFASTGSSESAGATPKPTSEPATDSTSEESGSTPETPAS